MKSAEHGGLKDNHASAFFVTFLPLLTTFCEFLLRFLEGDDILIIECTDKGKEVSAYIAHKHFYNECTAEVVQFCQKRNIGYYIKEETISEE